jgi:hypothetical protein
LSANGETPVCQECGEYGHLPDGFYVEAIGKETKKADTFFTDLPLQEFSKLSKLWEILSIDAFRPPRIFKVTSSKEEVYIRAAKFTEAKEIYNSTKPFKVQSIVIVRGLEDLL